MLGKVGGIELDNDINELRMYKNYNTVFSSSDFVGFDSERIYGGWNIKL